MHRNSVQQAARPGPHLNSHHTAQLHAAARPTCWISLPLDIQITLRLLRPPQMLPDLIMQCK